MKILHIMLNKISEILILDCQHCFVNKRLTHYKMPLPLRWRGTEIYSDESAICGNSMIRFVGGILYLLE